MVPHSSKLLARTLRMGPASRAEAPPDAISVSSVGGKKRRCSRERSH